MKGWLNMNGVCGLGQFAGEAAKAGYQNDDGTVNLLEAGKVIEKFGKLVPKSELSESDLDDLKESAGTLNDKYNLKEDVYCSQTLKAANPAVIKVVTDAVVAILPLIVNTVLQILSQNKPGDEQNPAPEVKSDAAVPLTAE